MKQFLLFYQSSFDIVVYWINWLFETRYFILNFLVLWFLFWQNLFLYKLYGFFFFFFEMETIEFYWINLTKTGIEKEKLDLNHLVNIKQITQSFKSLVGLSWESRLIKQNNTIPKMNQSLFWASINLWYSDSRFKAPSTITFSCSYTFSK